MGSNYIIQINDKTKKNPVFKIDKDFSINTISEIKMEINDVVENFEGFHLQVVRPENFDLTAIQLILAIKNKLGDRFSYTLELKDEHKLLLAHAGIDKYINI